METKTYKAIEDTAKEGLAVLKEVLTERATDESRLTLARIAATTVSNLTRVYQAQSAREATLVTLMGHAAPNPEEFRRLVMAALPASVVTKALAEPTVAKPSIA